MSTPTAAEMVNLIKAALEANPVGTVSATIEGNRVRWDRDQAMAELAKWEAAAARAASTRPVASRILLNF